MTAFYVFRALFLCFFGEYRGGIGQHPHHDDHGHDAHGHSGIHESPAIMWVPLAILAVLSLVGGYINVPKFLEPMFPLAAEGGNEWTMYVSVAFGLGGIALAFLFYIVAPSIPDALERALHPLYTFVYNKYFVDELYDETVVHPTIDGSRTLLWRGADVGLIDGAVNGVGKVARSVGGVLKLAQGGYIRDYAAWVVVGSIAVLLMMAFVGGAR